MPSRRILLINYEYPPVGGGSGNATRHIARGLAILGQRPIVLTAGHGEQPTAVDIDGVTIRRLPILRHETEQPTKMEIASFMVRAAITARKLAKEEKIDAVLAFFAFAGGLVGWVLKRLSGLPYVIALQSGDVPRPNDDGKTLNQKLIDASLKYLWRDASAVIANSDRLADMARRHDPDSIINVIPAGADVEGITPKEDYGNKGEDVGLLYVGRLTKQRGLEVLLPALAKITSALKWKLTLAGDGPEWPMIAAQAARFALIDRIELRGWQGWSVLPEIYRKADIFVLPSHEEGMPAALLEAMATGLPVVGARVGGMEEAVLNGETGLLVAPNDSDALADALTLMIADPTRWESMGRAGRARVESYYSWTSVAEKWLAVLESAIAATHSQSESRADTPRTT
jgi:glycogen(starch) synthase